MSKEMAGGVWYSQSRRVVPREHPTIPFTGYGENNRLNFNKDVSRAKKLNSFGSYTRSVLKTSLITSFPQIATYKSQKKRLWKILVFLFCLSGFLYQTLRFLFFYLTYPIIGDVEVTNPFEIVQPGLTFCSNNLIQRKAYCEKNYSNCDFEQDEDLFCSRFGKYCPDNGSRYIGVPSEVDAYKREYLDFTWEEIATIGPEMDMIDYCSKLINGDLFNCSIRPVPFITKSGRATICYTIESLMEQPKSEDDIYPNTFGYHIVLRTFPEKYFYHSDPVLIHVSVHDRRDVLNPYLNGYTLKGGYKYTAHVNMIEEERLPYPFRTNCTDYLSLWRKNNGTGPLNQVMCIDYCKLNEAISVNSCVSKFISYPHYEKLCPEGDVLDNEKIDFDVIKKCTMNCQPACLERKYEVEFDEMDFLNHVCADDENCRTSAISIKVSFRKYTLTRHIYYPKYNSLELFSYIGGFMGMWLGLSLVSIFDFFRICFISTVLSNTKMRITLKKKK